ncbi:reverse transcriptase domain-containing protein [Tanacetum coccineum]|uniref:Reverse transcriptase domain-containing protein n=1 Tax=Tanacetum coccineum TaxID=301880 RepID=A0ABQ5IR33_9ASTR
MARMDAMTVKMDAQYKELQSRAKQPTPDLDEDDMPTSREEEAKFMQTFRKTRFYNDYRDRDSNHDNLRSSDQNNYNRYNYIFNTDDKSYDLQRQFNDFMKSQQSTNAFHVNAVFTRSGKSYDPPVNLNDQQNKTAINFDRDDEDKEPTPQLKTQTPKPIKEIPIPKPYKPKILYPQRLRKEKMESQYGKFLDMIRVVRINIPLVDVLAGMPNYDKFLKELISNKHKIEQILAAFLSDESSAMIQNKVPPKLGDPESFLISMQLLKQLLIVRLADRLFKYLVGIAENMLVEVGKFTFPADFIILEMEEDSKVSLILGRPFLHTTDAVIRVKQKQLNLRVRTERMIFNIDSAIKHFFSNDDTCFSIDVIDEILEEDFDALLNEISKILHSIEGTILEEEIFSEYDKFIATAENETMTLKSVKVFMDDFSVFGNSFDKCLKNLDKMLQRCKDAHLVFKWEKFHFMVKEGIMLGHKVSSAGLEVDKAKINIISKLPPLPISKVLEAFLDIRNWNLPFELMCDASDFAVGVVLEFDIEIKDKKGTENVAANHLSQIDNNEISDDSEVDDNFLGETLMEINTRDEVWFADFANYLVGDIIPKGMTYQQKNKFFSDLKHYFWEEPYLFKVPAFIPSIISSLDSLNHWIHDYWRWIIVVYLRILPSCHPMIVTACATYVSDLRAKPTNKCAFTMADVYLSERELKLTIEMTEMTPP